MILVDTSVLIDFLKGHHTDPVKLLDDILEKKVSFGINEFIYQEILQGSKTRNEFYKIKEYLETIPFYHLHDHKESYERAAYNNVVCQCAGITIRSTIDFLIAQTAIENNLLLLHNDRDFDKMSKVIADLKIYTTKTVMEKK